MRIARLLLFVLAPCVGFAQDERSTNPVDVQTVPVAESDVVTATEDQEPPTDKELLTTEFARYKELVADGILDEAESTAKRVIELAIRVSGPRSMEMARALTNLAIVQQRTQQYEAAQQNFAAAIEIIEDNEDRLNNALVNPLRGLGSTQLAAGRPDLAARTFQRAVHITHVNDGPHNMGQLELLESLAETNLRMGLVDDAKQVNETIYSLNLRHFQTNPMDMVPSLMRRANWQRRTGYIFDEQATYRRIIRIIEDETSSDDVRLIPALTRLGNSYFYQDLSGAEPFQTSMPATGELYFKRALRIARRSPESDWNILSDALLANGDYNLRQSNLLRSKSLFLEAWGVMSADNAPERLKKRARTLERPEPLSTGILPRFGGSADNADRINPNVQLDEGTIIYTFDVSDRGRVENLKVVEANPREFYDVRRLLLRSVRSRLYRPRYEETGPVTTTGLTETHRFLYKPADLEKLKAEQAAENATD